MKTAQIISNIRRFLGIETLTDMQTFMLGQPAPEIILTSPTGSGKTLAFAIRMLRDTVPSAGRVQALVIAPSRELVMQISSVIRPIAVGLKTVVLYGGHSVADECSSLLPVPDIVIATPGRLLDHLQRGNLAITGLRVLVLDEYDKSLELGFEGEMKKIVRRIGHPVTTILTSATVLDEIPPYLGLNNPLKADFTEKAPRGDGRLATVEVPSFAKDKLDTLVALLRSIPAGERTIVFVNHRESAERVFGRLRADHIPAALYHGALDQLHRIMAVDLFNQGSAPVLVATDLAARGLDIAEVNNVIHYHLPVNQQAWTHRNGRTARMNTSGTAWVILSDADSPDSYIVTDRRYIPDMAADTACDIVPATVSLYISAGKKEKISRGDIAGFVAASQVTLPSEVGKISVHDHHSVVAVPRAKAEATAKALCQIKLKGKKAKVSVIKP